MAAQGFTSRVANLHVTIAFDREDHDWSELPPETLSEFSVASGERQMGLFKGGAVVLEIESLELTARWSELLMSGLYWKFDDYRPHVTLTYSLPPGVGIHAIQPFEGDILLGEEIIEEIYSHDRTETKLGERYA